MILFNFDGGIPRIERQTLNFFEFDNNEFGFIGKKLVNTVVNIIYLLKLIHKRFNEDSLFLV